MMSHKQYVLKHHPSGSVHVCTLDIMTWLSLSSSTHTLPRLEIPPNADGTNNIKATELLI
jgi:hypothetical protein